MNALDDIIKAPESVSYKRTNFIVVHSSSEATTLEDEDKHFCFILNWVRIDISDVKNDSELNDKIVKAIIDGNYAGGISNYNSKVSDYLKIRSIDKLDIEIYAVYERENGHNSAGYDDPRVTSFVKNLSIDVKITE